MGLIKSGIGAEKMRLLLAAMRRLVLTKHLNVPDFQVIEEGS